MKALLVICMLTCFAQSAFSQVKGDTSKIKIQFEQADNNYVVDSDSIIKEYVDSIEQIRSKNRLPIFLYNSCFAEELPIIIYHHPNMDLRWEIIKRVKNKKAIKLILNNEDKRLKDICSKKNDGSMSGEYANLSLYELFKMRYNNLQ
jgi:hypothetical protein